MVTLTSKITKIPFLIFILNFTNIQLLMQMTCDTGWKRCQS